MDEEIMDWEELRNQKLTIDKLREKFSKSALQDDVVQKLSGIVHLIDHLQDMAVNSGIYSSLEVFGFQAQEQFPGRNSKFTTKEG